MINDILGELSSQYGYRTGQTGLYLRLRLYDQIGARQHGGRRSVFKSLISLSRFVQRYRGRPAADFE